jgi:hypothetical protein
VLRLFRADSERNKGPPLPLEISLGFRVPQLHAGSNFPIAAALKEEGHSEGTMGCVQAFFVGGVEGPWMVAELAPFAPVDTVILRKSAARVWNLIRLAGLSGPLPQMSKPSLTFPKELVCSARFCVLKLVSFDALRWGARNATC